jgi:hypothetical protein
MMKGQCQGRTEDRKCRKISGKRPVFSGKTAQIVRRRRGFLTVWHISQKQGRNCGYFADLTMYIKPD